MYDLGWLSTSFNHPIQSGALNHGFPDWAPGRTCSPEWPHMFEKNSAGDHDFSEKLYVIHYILM